MRGKMKGLSFPRGKEPDKKARKEVSKGETNFGGEGNLTEVFMRIAALEKRVAKLERSEQGGSKG